MYKLSICSVDALVLLLVIKLLDIFLDLSHEVLRVNYWVFIALKLAAAIHIIFLLTLSFFNVIFKTLPRHGAL